MSGEFFSWLDWNHRVQEAINIRKTAFTMTTRGEECEDKENSPNFYNKAEAKEGRRSMGGGFSRLLNDVTNSIKLEHDEKLCQKMAAEMAAEHKELVRKDVNEGQALAIQLAVEERRRLQKEIGKLTSSSTINDPFLLTQQKEIGKLTPSSTVTVIDPFLLI